MVRMKDLQKRGSRGKMKDDCPPNTVIMGYVKPKKGPKMQELETES